jgi:hypothetical protein
VSFHIDPERGTIDIRGSTMGSTKKYRNVAPGSDRVAVMVDDVISLERHHVRGSRDSRPRWTYDRKTLANDLSAHLVYGLATAAAQQALTR